MARFNAAFRRWFADSKVVDENGEPLVVYHGTEAVPFFSEFHRKDYGNYFSSSRAVAKRYGFNVEEFYLRIENPLHIDGKGRTWKQLSVESFIEDARRAGHDGIIVTDFCDVPAFDVHGREFAATYVVFSPRQVKSVLNRGTWSRKDPGIFRNPGRLSGLYALDFPAMFLEAESEWAGGVADFGDPEAANIIQRFPGYFDYRGAIEDWLRENLGDTIQVFRGIAAGKLEDWLHNGPQGLESVTLNRRLAENWKNFAPLRGRDMRVIRIMIDPSWVVMRGKEEEDELVVDFDNVQPADIEVLA